MVLCYFCMVVCLVSSFFFFFLITKPINMTSIFIHSDVFFKLFLTRPLSLDLSFYIVLFSPLMSGSIVGLRSTSVCEHQAHVFPL